MCENNRLKGLDAVITAYKTLMAAHRGEVVCEVTTAKVYCFYLQEKFKVLNKISTGFG
jgi:F0F1-type ATP synthase delta subunit